MGTDGEGLIMAEIPTSSHPARAVKELGPQQSLLLTTLMKRENPGHTYSQDLDSGHLPLSTTLAC